MTGSSATQPASQPAAGPYGAGTATTAAPPSPPAASGNAPASTSTPTENAAEAAETPETREAPEASDAPNATEALEAEEPENETDDGASFDERLSSYSASLASSAVEYPTEYGRRYHAFRPGSYFMPNDEVEMDRLDLSHAITLKLYDYRMYLSPLEKDKVFKILDIGTGTGIWAMEMGDLFPNAEVYGNDLSPIQPDWVPPNVKFEIDDVESEWLDDRKYDFILCRYMVGSIADWPKLVKNIYDNLNPGGWAEFVDMSGEYYSDDGTLTENHATRKWNKTLVDAIASIGRESRPGPKLEGWVREAGYQNMVHQKFKVPIGPWAKDEFHKDVGWMNLKQVLQGLEGFTMRIFTGVLGWSREEVEVQLIDVRKELKAVHTFHALFDVHVVYGQKPLVEEEASQ
ncbi:Secondary metabolism regulator laeA [Colletotrichum sidae]|uniref:Secondary metabolism regulator laeA n=1 Tax=Colletotrichum sidae TaxID=1347389 RepID=A0A4R8T1V7_9PEZI|nr:Secondary metabolism regulator laeA [Colletotrichum sidae]